MNTRRMRVVAALACRVVVLAAAPAQPTSVRLSMSRASQAKSSKGWRTWSRTRSTP